ncbi:hypothetical protein [Caballeronia sp. LZ001]|uniref:hypothetical protein n=1 Tax=Caballeronia sp. LZ001 TaxID=3038553 RepID=UPI00285C8D99|nr:hypothetical protein [Caballeronia sp. LZ001]MDR5802137.1 hypothetical protein [Caballeronia sp. LZ001]
MAATQTDLAIRVLQKLKVLGVGQSASAEDLQVAKQAINEAHASLRKDRRVRWTLQELPEAAELPYVMLAATICAADFGAAADPGWGSWAEKEITGVIYTPRTDAPTRTEYF